ncbi:MAG: hypothetical protein RLY93_03770 [Sumerlaeia bacterium]
MSSPTQRPRLLCYGAMIAAGALLALSPRDQSGDSMEYAAKAILGEAIFHPHHLLHPTFLAFLTRLGDLLGFDRNLLDFFRLAQLGVAWIGLWAAYRFFRALRFARPSATLGTVLIAVSGGVWQYAGQIEAYNPGTAAIALSAWMVARAARITVRRGGAPGLAPWAVASAAIAFATFFHQIAALLSPALALLAFIELRGRAGITRRQSWLLPVGMLVVAGAISLGGHFLAYLIDRSPGMPFTVWITSYAHWSNTNWGLPEHLGVGGLGVLLRSWFGMWFNVDPFEYYHPAPGYTLKAAAALALAFGAAWVFVAVRALRTGERRWRHAAWIALWMIATESFLLWWTPFQRSMQNLSILPQVTLLLLAASALGQMLRARGVPARRLRAAGIATGAAAALLLVAVGAKSLAIPGLARRTEPEGELLLLKPLMAPEDLVMTSWPLTRTIPALMNHRRVTEPFPPLDDPDAHLPDWRSATPGAGRNPRVIVHRRAIAIDPVLAHRAERNAAEHFDRLLTTLEERAGGTGRLRANLVAGPEGILAVVYGIDPDLPLTAAQARAALEGLRPTGY